MPSIVQIAICDVQINGNSIPVLSCRVKVSSQGSIGSCEIKTNRTQSEKVNYVEGGNNTVDVYATDDNASYPIFSGKCKGRHLDATGDTWVYKARDLAGTLVDDKRTLADIKYKNQTVGQVVKSIADAAGLDSDIDPDVQSVQAGTEYNGQRALINTSQPLWSTLQQLGQQNDCEVRVEPPGKLVFKKAKAGSGGQIEVTWMASDISDPNPLLHFDFEEDDEKHGDFEVHVLSHHPQKGQLTKGSTYVVGKKRNGKSKKSSLNAGVHSGSAFDAAYAAYNKTKTGGSSTKAKKNAKKVYTYNLENLSTEECQTRADSYAKDIAKKEIKIMCKILVKASLSLHTIVTLREGRDGDLDGLAGENYAVSEIEHVYESPQGESGSGGFFTEFTAINIPD